MKKKNLVLVGIAVCVMLVILLTSPMLASAGYSQIYGNANEDDTLDMRDVTYIKLVIFGKKPATDFADANYDGKISMLDVGQTKLIILGKEKQLTLIDQADRTVMVQRPVERIVAIFPSITRIILALDGCNRLEGVSSITTSGERANKMIMLQAYPELLELPNTGHPKEPNAEQIVFLKPDVIFGCRRLECCSPIQEKTGIPVVGIYTNPNIASGCFESYRLAGKIIGKEERAEELIEFNEEKFAELAEVTSQIPDSEKPRVHLAFWGSITESPGSYYPVDLAGGINVISSESSVTVSKEQVIAWNPDFILIHAGPSGPDRLSIEGVLSDPDLQTVNAVKNKSVYYTKGHFIGWDPATGLTETFYMAKLFYPDKFEDLDVEKEGNRILANFYGVDGLYTWIQENCDLYRWE